jgi:hypothetical protein
MNERRRIGCNKNNLGSPRAEGMVIMSQYHLFVYKVRGLIE